MGEMQSAGDREYYSSSLASLQVEFVRNKVRDNTQMKNLIRLVKHWRKTHFPVGITNVLLTCHLSLNYKPTNIASKRRYSSQLESLLVKV